MTDAMAASLRADRDAILTKIDNVGEALAAMCEAIAAHHRMLRGSTTLGADDEPTTEGFDTLERLIKAEPAKWLSVGRIDLQQGLMALRRSVAQPTTF